MSLMEQSAANVPLDISAVRENNMLLHINAKLWQSLETQLVLDPQLIKQRMSIYIQLENIRVFVKGRETLWWILVVCD